MRPAFPLYLILLIFPFCSEPENNHNYSQSDGLSYSASVSPYSDTATSALKTKVWNYADTAQKAILTGNTTPEQLVSYAETLQGIPYKYGSVDPEEGFDCSGFITYLFGHFNIAVPRSSKDFTNVHQEISLKEAVKGDIILFTGTDSTIRVVGHMGVISSHENGEIKFIHSTSGKANGVTITPLNSYYQGRFVKVIRVFKNEYN